MIPKVIHYCWFGRNPLPPLAVKCIESWRKFLPDYEIREWNEDNFDVNAIPYTREAYEAKKYAFVSDYARFKILYEHGGLYFDTDVEVIRPLDDIIARGPFMGCERDTSGATAPAVAPGLGLGVNPGLGLGVNPGLGLGVNPGLGLGVNPGLGLGVNPGLGLGVNPGLGLGVNPGLGLYRELLDLYATLHFRYPDGSLNFKTVVQYTTELLCEHGLRNTADIQQVASVWVYPKEYFCPIDYNTKECRITERTYSIHHYAGSWIKKRSLLMMKLKCKAMDWFGKKNVEMFIKLLKLRKLRKCIKI